MSRLPCSQRVTTARCSRTRRPAWSSAVTRTTRAAAVLTARILAGKRDAAYRIHAGPVVHLLAIDIAAETDLVVAFDPGDIVRNRRIRTVMRLPRGGAAAADEEAQAAADCSVHRLAARGRRRVVGAEIRPVLVITRNLDDVGAARRQPERV